MVVWQRRLREGASPYMYVRAVTENTVMMSIIYLSPPQDDPLWSARLLHTYPSVIRQVHESYLNHGADIIITSSYQVVLEIYFMYSTVTYYLVFRFFE